MILGSIIHLIFAIKDNTADETLWTLSITAIIGGLGLMFAGDSNVSANASQVKDLTNRVENVENNTTTFTPPQ